MFADLKTFLLDRIRAREAMECGVSPRKFSFIKPRITTVQPAAQVHAIQQLSAQTSNFNVLKSLSQVKPSSSQPPSASNKCKLCSQKHFVVYCPQICAYSPDKKQQWVTQLYLCTNYLASHNISQYHNPKTCAYCKQHHHSMLHGTAALTKSKQVQKNPTPTPPVAPTSRQLECETSSEAAASK